MPWPEKFDHWDRSANFKNSRHGGPAKVEKVMHEFKEGDLKSSSGAKVTSKKQAVAIAMSEAGMSRKKKK